MMEYEERVTDMKRKQQERAEQQDEKERLKEHENYLRRKEVSLVMKKYG